MYAAMRVVFVTVLFHAADWNKQEEIFEVLTLGLTDCCGWMAGVACLGKGSKLTQRIKTTQKFLSVT